MVVNVSLVQKYMQHVVDQILPSMRFQAGQSQYRSNLSRNHLKDKCITEQYNMDNQSHSTECTHVLRPDINLYSCAVYSCAAPRYKLCTKCVCVCVRHVIRVCTCLHKNIDVMYAYIIPQVRVEPWHLQPSASFMPNRHFSTVNC